MLGKKIMTFFNGYKNFKALLVLVIATWGAAGLQAKDFIAPFIKFALPPGWDCSLEGTEWVCQSDNPKVRREAIIISAAKPKSAEDTIENFFQHLGKTKKKKDLSGNEYETEIKFTKQRQINGVQWVDSLHYGSEIPGFFTRYLATVNKNLAILITYSIAKNRYKDYNNDFNNLIKTLTPIDPKDIEKADEDSSLFAGANKNGNLAFEAGAGKDDEGAELGEEADNAQGVKTAAKKAKPAGDDSMSEYLMYGGIGLAVLGAAFFVLRKKGGDDDEDGEDQG